MKKIIDYLFFFILCTNHLYAQSVDDVFSQKKMRKDLEVFKEIRVKANSGLYKYRTENQIDSIYRWAEKEIEKSSTYRDFYNIISQLTDFEGSLHNATNFPKILKQSLSNEKTGYFPYPIKWIDRKWVINFEHGTVPLGAEVIAINGHTINDMMNDLYKYYTTDGINTTGKRIGIRTHFSKYFRLNYGLKPEFEIQFKKNNSDHIENRTIYSIGYSDYYKNFRNRYSKQFDQIYYDDLPNDGKYTYEKIDASTAVLTIHTFSMGNKNSEEHKTYVAFLDDIFTNIETENIENLIVDIRQNSGGTDPNDIITYSYLTQRNFQENREAWIGFRKIPFLKYYDINVPKLLRPLGVGKYNKLFQKDFYVEKDNRYYQGSLSDDHKIRSPNKRKFTKKVYLLISPAVASAASLFAAMVVGNENTYTIGEETMGGYYGHNGHSALNYKLPKSKLEFSFSVVNLEQDVVKKSNQFYNRGIIPDYNVSQSFEDYLNHKDVQMEFVLDLIRQNSIK